MRVALLLLLFWLAGCAGPLPTAEPPPPPTAAPPKEDPEADAPPAPTDPLPLGWTTVLWEGLAVPLPPGAGWDEASPVPSPPEGVPVLAAGAIRYPARDTPVEQPEGPRFLILEFSRPLEAWLDHQERQDPLGVDRATLARLSVAGAPALRYQPVVTGTCNAASYLLRLDDRRLLWVWVNCLGGGRDDEVIRLLRPAP